MSRIDKIIFLLFLVSSYVFAHEGHDHGAPGALPFAPHGGKVAEAEVAGKGTHSHGDEHDDHDEDEDGHKHGGHDEKDHEEGAEHKHDHDDDHENEKKAGPKSSIEYFFEALFENGKLIVFPLGLDSKNLKEFIQIDPDGKISELQVTVEFPRSKKFESVSMTLVPDQKRGVYWEGKVPANKDIRFYANVRANWQGVERKSKIHLEKRK